MRRALSLRPLDPLPTPRGERAMPVLPAGHEEPFDAYVRAMARELVANEHKGDRAAWRAQSPGAMVSEVLYHAAKLSYALRRYQRGAGTAEEVLEFAADVGNTAMMVADAAGVLATDAVAAGEAA